MVVTGGTGFVGAALVRALVARGDEVTVLTRDLTRGARRVPPGARPAAWNPEATGEWQSVLEGQHAVVHLAGEPAVGQRWTPAVKARIRDSRVRSTEVVVQALARMSDGPRVLVAASGVGFYGDRDGSLACDEGSPAGSDFLAGVCQAWERAASGATARGIRVVSARLGIVLGEAGGALGEMLAPFRAFVGGPLGSGRQVVSWIHAADAVRALCFCLDDERLSGPVNVVSPGAVTSRELATALGRALGRPSWISAPALALRARFGEGADPLLTGQRAVPQKLVDLGFAFEHPEIGAALGVLLGGGS